VHATPRLVRLLTPTLARVMPLALSCVLGAACSGAAPAPSAALDPAGVDAGKALRAAFPDFDPAHPVAVTGFDLKASDLATFPATPETLATVGIDRWESAEVSDPATSSDDQYFAGYVGAVRALAVHFHATAAAGADPSTYTEVQGTFEFDGQMATDALLVAGNPSPSAASLLQQKITPLLDFELGAAP
jgi:hypothetical protein